MFDSGGKVNAKASQQRCCEAQIWFLKSSILFSFDLHECGGRGYAVLLFERGRKM